ncbi:MAG: hypothetical protein HQ465_27955 [Rhodospirillales bacterium]|nr:hypothetical protein [Rhodospirillales bacterium]
MTILLLGAGPRLAWVRSILETHCAPAGAPSETGAETGAEIVVFEGPPTHEALLSLTDRPIDALVLVDHFAFADGAVPEAAALAEAVRGEAQRAVLALELSRRAARTLRLSGDAEDWLNVLTTLLAVPLPAEPPATCPPPAGPITPVATPLLHSYLEPLFAAPGQGPSEGQIGSAGILALAWPREAFLDGDAPGETLPATVEVAGRARILAYGPYLPLPAGDWQATAFLGFSHDIGRLPFILDADTGGAVARGFFEVERGGIFTLVLDFKVTDALHPIELRLISQDSALEGQLALIEVELKQSLPQLPA